MTDLEPLQMTIGPVGLDIPLHGLAAGTWRGDTGSFSSSFGAEEGYTVVECRHLRDQLQGLASLSRGVVPCRFGGTPELDGSYILGDVTISTDDNSFGTGAFDLDVQLTRPRTWQQLVQQEIVVGGLRTQPDGSANAHSIGLGNVRAWHSPGVDTYGLLVNGGLLSGAEVVGSADGDLVIVYDADETLFDATARWWVDAADHDRGAAQIRVSPGHDGRFFRVVGQQVVNHPYDWMLTNGRFALTCAGGSRFGVSFNHGGGWSQRKVFELTAGPAANALGMNPRLVRVTRESPERSGLRVVFAGGDIEGGLVTFDAQLRRGATFVECIVAAPGPLQWGLREIDPVVGTVGLGDLEPGETHTSGVHAKVSDADGVKVWLSSPQEVQPAAPTDDVDNVAIQLVDDSSQFAFGIGGELDGGDHGGEATYSTWVYRYFHAAFTDQRPVLA